MMRGRAESLNRIRFLKQTWTPVSRTPAHVKIVWTELDLRSVVNTYVGIEYFISVGDSFLVVTIVRPTERNEPREERF